jgi:hypothetical protein
MAVVDLKVNSEAEAGRNDVVSGKEIVVPFFHTTGVADSIGSVVRLACGIPADAIVTEISIWSDGVTSLNDVDVGVYKNESLGGGVIDADCFGDALDLSGSVAKTVINGGLVTLANGDYGKTIFNQVGTTLMPVRVPVDICLTFKVATSEADQIAGRVKFIAP